jgi:hypothetical protein
MLFIALATIVASVISASGKFWVISTHLPIIVEQVAIQQGDIVRDDDLLLIAKRVPENSIFMNMDESPMSTKGTNGSEIASLWLKALNGLESASIRAKVPKRLGSGIYMVIKIMVSEGERYEEGTHMMVLETLPFGRQRDTRLLTAKL